MQQAITPEAVALAIFGLVAAVAMVVLVAQGLAQLAGRFAPDVGALRALGASRRQVLLAACLPGMIPVAGITALAGAGAVAVSPLSPVGPVRDYDPAGESMPTPSFSVSACPSSSSWCSGRSSR